VKNGELDAVWLDRARAGDPRAFRVLYDHHADAVYGFLRRMLRESAATEDALQDAFLRVLRSLPRFRSDGPARLSTWIFTIARRAALDALARRDRVTGPALPQVAAPDAASELRLSLEAALERLPPAQRSVFVLSQACELSYEEVALIEEVDVGTVKSRLHRARAALQAMLESDDSDDEPDDARRAHATR
jgi:RNA polymerase sigma-70 factor (ECF subfamily)